MKSLERTIFRESGLLILGTLMAAFGLAAATLYAEAIALGAAGAVQQLVFLAREKEKRDEIRATPEFFYWDVVKQQD
jgi:hypothetical protein